VIGVIADDLTGACDSSVPFLGGGAVRVGIWPYVPVPEGLAAVAVSTESRDSPPEVGCRRAAEAVGRLPGALAYRKLDSMLRGNPCADVEVLVGPGRRALVAPALPGEGRVTVGGVQRWPEGSADLTEIFGSLGDRVEILDASCDADLDAAAGRVLTEPGLVAAGSAGLAAALARALGLPPAPPGPRPGCRHPLAVVGTPAAAEQVRVAQAAGWPVAVAGPGEVPDVDGADGFLLTGGETAARVLLAQGASGVELVGEPLPRIPLARVLGGRLGGRPVMLKAGSFGAPDAIARSLEVLRAGA
jgi:uncharacterized protein YgbK (DUF1537 family)